MTKKIIASFVGLTMALTMVPGMTLGATVEELQAQITILMAQITALNTQITALTGTTPATGPSACVGITFTRNLSQGSTGTDVKCLQALLNTNPATQVAATGVGSLGMETTYFGPMTRAAVVKMQNLYAAEVLTPIGLTAGTGFVGPQTRAKLNAMLTKAPKPDCVVDADCPAGYECVAQKCVAVKVIECTTDEDCPDGYICVAGECEKEKDVIVDPSEGYLEVRWSPTPTGVEAAWGATNVAVGAIELKAIDSAIKVDRVDINFINGLPWRSINYLALYDGDKAIRGLEVTAENLHEVTFLTDYRLRLTNLGINVPKGSTKNITVRVNVDSYPRTTGTVLMHLKVNAVRGADTMGFTQSGPDTTPLARDFTIAGVGQGARIETRLNDATPSEGIVLSDEFTATNHEVLRFDLKVTKDSAQVRQIIVGLDGDLARINAVYLRDLGTDTVLGSQTPTATTSFANLQVNIAKDTTKTLAVEVQYMATTTSGEVTASVAGGTGTTHDGVLAVSAGGEATSYLGSSTGNTIYFYNSGVKATFVSATLTETKAGEATTTTAWLDGTITFRLAAVGEDVIIPADGITVRAWLIATATSTGTTVSPVLITIDAQNLATAATTTRTLIAGGASKTIVAQGRISNSVANAYVRLEVDKVAWTGGNLSSEQIKDLKTESKIFVK